MIDPKQLRHYIIQPVLKDFGFYSKSAENLIFGTGCVESQCGKYIHQLNNGCALGIFQMEPSTHFDIWTNFLSSKKRKKLVKQIYSYFQWKDMRPCAKELIHNLKYAALMCRIHYLRFEESLPAYDDIIGLARYWKKYYNTKLGDGTVEKFIHDYEKFNKI